ncbi:MAG: hypothetical protein ACP5SH_10260 [Syntrophobacteraceae bacterium]
MSRTRLGGVKVIENRAWLNSVCRTGGDPLASICSTFAAGRINLGMLTHVADNGCGQSITAASAKNASCFSGYMIEAVDSGNCREAEVEDDAARVSVFPHGQRPEIAASVISLLGGGAIKPYGLASSPSAMTIVVSSSDFEAAMERIFASFDFTACASYDEWRALCRMDEQQLSVVRFSYDEQVITTYGFMRQAGLDLWSCSLPVEEIDRFGSFLYELGELRSKLPFLISTTALTEEIVYFSFALGVELREKASQMLEKHLSRSDGCRTGPVSVIFVHGPHFGDRYGIARAFTSALREGGVSILALSCAVSSISAVIAGSDPDRAVECLKTRFQTPAVQD